MAFLQSKIIGKKFYSMVNIYTLKDMYYRSSRCGYPYVYGGYPYGGYPYGYSGYPYGYSGYPYYGYPLTPIYDSPYYSNPYLTSLPPAPPTPLQVAYGMNY